MSAGREELLCRLARDYAEREGARLRAELAAEAPSPTPGLDKKVRGGLFKLKYAVYFRGAWAIAACLALVLLLPHVLRGLEPGVFAPAPQMAAPAPAAGALPEAEAAFDGDFAAARIEGEFGMYVAPDVEPYGIFDAHTNRTEPAMPPYQYGYVAPEVAGGQIIWGYDYPVGFGLPATLGFELPEGFYLVDTYIGTTTDEGNPFSVYYFEHGGGYRWEIILLVSPNGRISWDHFDLSNNIQLGGYTIFYSDSFISDTGGYMSMALEKNDTLYIIIGDYGISISNLLPLAEAIIAG